MQATLRYKGSRMGSVYFSTGVRAHLDGERVESGEGKDHMLRYGDVFCSVRVSFTQKSLNMDPISCKNISLYRNRFIL